MDTSDASTPEKSIKAADEVSGPSDRWLQPHLTALSTRAVVDSSARGTSSDFVTDLADEYRSWRLQSGANFVFSNKELIFF